MSANPLYEAQHFADWLYNFSFVAPSAPSSGSPQLSVGLGGEIPVFPPLAALLVVVLGLILQGMFGRWRFLPWPLKMFPLRLALFALAIAYQLNMKRMVEDELSTKQTGIRFTPVKGLVTTGPFERSRNPLYDATWPLIPALAVLLDSIALLVVSPLFPAYLSKIVIPAEEKLLSKGFPRQWKQYTSTTPRWGSWF